MAREVLRLVGAGAALATAVLFAVVLAGSGGWPFPLPKWLGSGSSPAAFASTTMGHASGGDEEWEWREVWFGNGASVAFAIRPGHGPPVLLLHGTSPPPPTSHAWWVPARISRDGGNTHTHHVDCLSAASGGEWSQGAQEGQSRGVCLRTSCSRPCGSGLWSSRRHRR